MERKFFISILALLILIVALGIPSCSNKKAGGVESITEHTHSYTCPMHPQIISDAMDVCPICGMDLVPFEKNEDGALKINARGQMLANINTVIVGDSSASVSRRLNGRLTTDPGQSAYISSRIAGRIEQLYVKESGVRVSKGMPLYKIYSEQLASLQQEYLMALAQEKQFPGDRIEKQLVTSAKQKLLLYGQSESQLRRLAESGKTEPHTIFYAPESGIVAELLIGEGQYVEEGSPLVRLEAYESLWVEADIYPGELKDIRAGDIVKVIVPGWEDQPQQMSLTFVAPEIQAGSRLIRIRGSIPNPGGAWQPGLQAIVLLPLAAHRAVPVLPVDAVIRDNRGMHVWVKIAEDSFEPRLVTTGQETADEVEIIEGLTNGDEVVVSGTYLLYSEYILKRGKNPVEDLQMMGHL